MVKYYRALPSSADQAMYKVQGSVVKQLSPYGFWQVLRFTQAFNQMLATGCLTEITEVVALSMYDALYPF